MSFRHLNRFQAHFDQASLKPTERLTAWALANSLNDKNPYGFNPTNAHLAKLTGNSEATVRRAVDLLVASGLFVQHRSGRGKAYSYALAVDCPAECRNPNHKSKLEKLLGVSAIAEAVKNGRELSEVGALKNKPVLPELSAGFAHPDERTNRHIDKEIDKEIDKATSEALDSLLGVKTLSLEPISLAGYSTVIRNALAAQPTNALFVALNENISESHLHFLDYCRSRGVATPQEQYLKRLIKTKSARFLLPPSIAKNAPEALKAANQGKGQRVGSNDFYGALEAALEAIGQAPNALYDYPRLGDIHHAFNVSGEIDRNLVEMALVSL